MSITDEYIETIKKNIRVIFKDDIFDIEINISVPRKWLFVFIRSRIWKTADDTCVILRVNMIDKIIRIDSLDRCDVGDEGKGTAMLSKLNDLALSLPEYNYIKLRDISTINLCDTVTVSLPHLKILTKGMSWYNSHGYFSTHKDEELRHNNSFIRSQISETPNLRDILKVGDSESVFPNVNTGETVQDYVSRLLEKIPVNQNFIEFKKKIEHGGIVCSYDFIKDCNYLISNKSTQELNALYQRYKSTRLIGTWSSDAGTQSKQEQTLVTRPITAQQASARGAQLQAVKSSISNRPRSNLYASLGILPPLYKRSITKTLTGAGRRTRKIRKTIKKLRRRGKK